MIQVWETVAARAIHGERQSLAVVELDPAAHAWAERNLAGTFLVVGDIPRITAGNGCGDFAFAATCSASGIKLIQVEGRDGNDSILVDDQPHVVLGVLADHQATSQLASAVLFPASHAPGLGTPGPETIYVRVNPGLTQTVADQLPDGLTPDDAAELITAFQYSLLPMLNEPGADAWKWETRKGAVMDGVPVFNLARESLPGVLVTGFRGVINTTCQYALGQMERGVSLDDGPCGRGLVVGGTDYHSTNLSILDAWGRTRSESFLSSASAATGLSAPLSGDVVVPPSATHSPVRWRHPSVVSSIRVEPSQRYWCSRDNDILCLPIWTMASLIARCWTPWPCSRRMATTPTLFA